MAGCGQFASSDRGGHPSTSMMGQHGVRDDPNTLQFPIQETGLIHELAEEDGLPSTIFLNPSEDTQPNPLLDTSIAQSASGFSDDAMNIASGGHLQQLPPVVFPHLSQYQNIPGFHDGAHGTVADLHVSSVSVPVQSELRLCFGDAEYERLQQECFKSNLKARMDPDDASTYASYLLVYNATVMCVVCRSQKLVSEGAFEHYPACPVHHFLRKTLLAQNGISVPNGCQSTRVSPTKKTRSNVLWPKAETEDRTERPGETVRPTQYHTANGGTQLVEGEQTLSGARTTHNNTLERRLGPGHRQDPLLNGAQQAHYSTSHAENTERKFPPGHRHEYPEYATIHSRYRSFENWPATSKQKPKELAQAGLFYTGFLDHCRCFDCGGKLRDWEDEDDPIHEHEKWFPDCLYAQRMKKARLTENRQQNLPDDVTPAVANLTLRQNHDSFARRLNPDLCGVCRQRTIEVTQLHCLHIVCRSCLPTQGRDGTNRCQVCNQEVVNIIAYDANCRRPV